MKGELGISGRQWSCRKEVLPLGLNPTLGVEVVLKQNIDKEPEAEESMNALSATAGIKC